MRNKAFISDIVLKTITMILGIPIALAFILGVAGIIAWLGLVILIYIL